MQLSITSNFRLSQDHFPPPYNVALFVVIILFLLFQICNNGMLTLNQVWREGYPTVFETDSWYDDKPIIAPYWAQSDEAIMELLADEYPDAQSKVYYQVYQKSTNMAQATIDIIDRATQDVSNHGTGIQMFFFE